ncbi:hypothetical protein P171DRAFT_438256 [Karstenula rhodostoma CBS 690.94]|uniref:RING-type domain-containing protein n=1 Tax=Karstenula rhodostoma CBS 690.94 TaxID=1392251 RepID=A0A9P4PYB4_9PLEO|nr:hypothetical protein P171DRAFT_438256 [Karstenula rhodostoma CBS 690.94]
MEISVHPNSLAFRTLPDLFDSTNVSPSSSFIPLEGDHEFIDLDSFSTVVERDCPICLAPKVKWRRLRTCGHELCEDCLREQMHSSLQNKFLCPFDRRSFFDSPPQ